MSARKAPDATVGGRIRQARFALAAREGRNRSQTWLAQAVGVSSGAVSQWEADATEPGLNYLRALGQALGVSAGWLAFGEDGPPLINPATDRKLTDEEIQRARAQVAADRASRSAAAQKKRHSR